ncbi:MAG: chlorite dismutase family protein [Ilumatobacteraceae bacterium]
MTDTAVSDTNTNTNTPDADVNPVVADSFGPVVPSTGLTVTHLFCHTTDRLDPEAVVAAVKAAEAEDASVITASMLGHKADVAFMVLHADVRIHHRFQTALQAAGLKLSDSYVSITEVSEYAKGMPAEMLQPRLYPVLPPAGKHAFCFYPMSKRRENGANWFTLPYDERVALMMEHGKSGRTFAGRIVQLITGSTGLDDYEWGVTLFGNHVDDVKDVVYTMRFDRASAIFADFGTFYIGAVTPVEQLFG